MLHRIWKALCVLALLTPALAAQSYEINLKHKPVKGGVEEVKVTESQVGSTKVLDANGNLLKEEKPSVTKLLEYTTTVLEGGDKKAAKFKETYAKAVQVSGKDSTNLPYHGRTVVYELKGDKYEVKSEGEPALTDKDLEELAKQVNERDEELNDLVLPGKAVKVGDTWAIEPKKLVEKMSKAINGEVDAEKTKLSGKLVKAYKKDQQQWGVLEVEMKFPLKSVGPLKLDTPGELNVKVTLDAAIDGSSPAGTMKTAGDMAIKATVEQMGMKFNVESRMDMNSEKTVKEKK